MQRFINEPIQKGKMYYFVRYANSRKLFAICETHQKANGIIYSDTVKNAWINPDWDPLTLEKGYYI